MNGRTALERDPVALELAELRREVVELRKLYAADRAAVLDRLTRFTAGAKMAMTLIRRML